MHTAVIIPFRDRGDANLLAWTLEGYATQALGRGNSMEVWVGIDGGREKSGRETPWDLKQDARVSVRSYPRKGAAAVRNALAAEVSPEAELLIFGNADARPEAGMVQRHIDAMKDLPAGSVVLGAAPWEMPEAPTVWDALLAETPMVFFYGQLKAHEWHDFRHVWTLNASVRVDDFRRCGGFQEKLRPVYYEDLELGHRLMGTRKGVWYEPEARVLHRHPTTLEQYLDREELLGLMAPVLARVSPDVFETLFKRRDAAALAREFAEWVTMDRSLYQWIYRRLKEWAKVPETALAAGEGRERMLMTIYQMHVPLKRLAFRLGFLKGIELAGDEQWEKRVPAGLWRSVVGDGPGSGRV